MFAESEKIPAQKFGGIGNILYLCSSKSYSMEEKRYPIFEEEESVGMVCEPIAEAVADYPQSINCVLGEQDWDDDLDLDKIPPMGPFSDEEAIARIDRFEERLAKGEVKWVSSDEVTRHLYEKFPWLR